CDACRTVLSARGVTSSYRPLPSPAPSPSYPRFFFHYYPPHRDLHSFPTRRSSDLIQRSLEAWQAHAPASVFFGMTLRQFKDAVSDRKSTRLNSSHQIISYAVFCLKKKKKYRS